MHLVGVGGSGMKALAELLCDAGYEVSGSDRNPAPGTAERLRQRGVRLEIGHDPQHLREGCGLLVYSPAVPAENVERLAAATRGVPEMSYPAALGQFMLHRRGVCVAGTHGKSTTTAMTAAILEAAGLRPSVVIGAEVCGRRASGWAGTGEHFVVESCEYQRHFLELHPRFAAILAVEPDHFDCFPTWDLAIDAYTAFAARIPANGFLLVRHDCPPEIRSATPARSETFALIEPADWHAREIAATPTGSRFQLHHRGQMIAACELHVPGQHNILNAIAAAALAEMAGVPPHQIRRGLADFRGIARRFEVRGVRNGVTVIDDYAHHPTAITAVLETARAHYPGRRIVCVFQPHQLSRLQRLLPEFAASLAAAERVFIAPVYAAREGDPSECTAAIAELARQIGPQARCLSSLDRIPATLDDETDPGDTLLILGAGDIDAVSAAFLRQGAGGVSPELGACA